MQSRSAPRGHVGDRGFTLIELLVVVIVVGILAGVAIPVFLNQRQKAFAASLTADMKQARTLMQDYQFETEGSLGTACYDHAACHSAGGPGNFLTASLDMKFSPGNRVGDFWGGSAGGAARTFHVCIEHVESGTPTSYRAIDTSGHGNWVWKGTGGCPWINVNVTEPQPAP